MKPLALGSEDIQWLQLKYLHDEVGDFSPSSLQPFKFFYKIGFKFRFLQLDGQGGARRVPL